jgi:hypothetical protein
MSEHHSGWILAVNLRWRVACGFRHYRRRQLVYVKSTVSFRHTRTMLERTGISKAIFVSLETVCLVARRGDRASVESAHMKLSMLVPFAIALMSAFALGIFVEARMAPHYQLLQTARPEIIRLDTRTGTVRYWTNGAAFNLSETDFGTPQMPR